MRLEIPCRSIRALHFSGTDNMEQAVTWIVEHEHETDLDDPLLVPKVQNIYTLSVAGLSSWTFENSERHNLVHRILGEQMVRIFQGTIGQCGLVSRHHQSP